MKTFTPKTPALLFTLLASVALLAACDRPADAPIASERTSDAVAQGERKVDQAGQAVREAGRDASQAVGNAVDTVASKSSDMAITATVNTKLAADKDLSALGINVDTTNGRVVLRGSAPDTAARTRATELARTVDGVTDVTNELNVQPR